MAIKTAPPTQKFGLGLAAGPNLKGMPLKRQPFKPGQMIMPPKAPKAKKPGTDLVHVPRQTGPSDAGVRPNAPFKMLSARQQAPRLQAALEARKPMLALEGPSNRPAIAGRAPMRELANPRRKAVEQKFTPFGELGPGKAEPKISKETPRHGSSRAAGIKPEPTAAKPKAGAGTPPPKAEKPKTSAGPGPGSTRGSGSSGGQAPKASAGGDKDAHFKVLGLNANSTQKDFKLNYRRLAREFNTDNGKNANKEKYQQINAAYESLKNHKWAD